MLVSGGTITHFVATSGRWCAHKQPRHGDDVRRGVSSRNFQYWVISKTAIGIHSVHYDIMPLLNNVI